MDSKTVLETVFILSIEKLLCVGLGLGLHLYGCFLIRKKIAQLISKQKFHPKSCNKFDHELTGWFTILMLKGAK